MYTAGYALAVLFFVWGLWLSLNNKPRGPLEVQVAMANVGLQQSHRGFCFIALSVAVFFLTHQLL